MVLKRCPKLGFTKQCSRQVEQLDEDRLDRLARSGLVEFTLRATASEGRRTVETTASEGRRTVEATASEGRRTDEKWQLWVIETVPRHGCREAPLATRCRDWREEVAALAIAHELLGHMREWGLINLRRCERVEQLLALEVIRQLPPGWRLTGRHVLWYVEREMTGAELVRLLQD